MPLIPEGINLLPENPTWSMFEKPLKEVLQKGYFRMFLARMYSKLRMKYYVKRNSPKDQSAIMGYLGDCVSKILPSLYHLGTYDLAISFLTPHNFVKDHILAQKKVCWIHTDYTKIDVNAELELSVWQSYDNVVSISEDVTKTFSSVFPSLKDKIVEIGNILSPEFVRSRAEMIPECEIEKEMATVEGRLNLLTIGRYSPPKKLEEIPAICRGILEHGIDITWYIIGFGASNEYIRKEIEKEGMQDRVILLGKKENPYPYIKACDWYIQPSRYEGKSVVVREAQILGKPVMITNYPTAASQINHCVDGVIVPMDIDACVEHMVDALRNIQLKEQIIEFLKNNDYGNVAEVEKIYKFITSVPLRDC